MDKNLYKIMEEIMAQKSSNKTIDVKYLGTIFMEEESPNGTVKVTRDIIAMIDIEEDGTPFIKYYDENQALIAVRGTDGELYPSEEFRFDDLAFLSEIDSTLEQEGISFKDLDEKLEKLSKHLGIDKSDILSMSETELDTVITNEEEGKLSIFDDENSNLTQEEKSRNNSNALENIDSKQEIELDNKVDNKYNLAQILNVPTGSKLVIVDSNKIQNNEVSTRFSCIIKTPSGELLPADMLNQVGGKNSDKNVREVDRQGKVQKQNIQSSFAIDSSLTDNAVITIRRGTMGTTKVAYGITDPTSHRDVFAQDLETSETYPVSAKVRSEFSHSHGVYNATDKIDEIEKHEAHGERVLSLQEADGRPETGHIHGEEAAELILADDDFVRTTNDLYSTKDVSERFESIMEKHPNLNRDELIELTKEELVLDAEHMHSHELRSLDSNC